MDVLLVRFGALGDVVLTLGATAALKRARPQARVTYLVKREYAPLVADQEGVDRVWTLDPGEARGVAGAFALRRRVAAGGFAAKVDWQTNTRSRIALSARARSSRGAPSGWPGGAGSRSAGRIRDRSARPGSATWTRWRRSASTRPPRVRRRSGRRPPPRPRRPPSSRRRIARRPPRRRWRSPRARAGRRNAGRPRATRRLVAARRDAGERVLLVGDARDRAALGALARPEDPGVRWFDGDLPAVAAALARARGVLANDSGLLHLAAAVGRPTVAIFASTHPALGFAPAGEGACSADPCRASPARSTGGSAAPSAITTAPAASPWRTSRRPWQPCPPRPPERVGD